jgi:hypothetical protein
MSKPIDPKPSHTPRVNRRLYESYLCSPVDDLIPLHRYDETSNKYGRTTLDGKRPLDSNWTTRRYDPQQVIRTSVAKNRNVGVRLSGRHLIIDVDPRNGGDAAFPKLCYDIGLDPDKFPTAITGSGGLHVYMGKPKDIRVVDTLEHYPGVEFKSTGRQVVSVGSIHPVTKKLYKWLEGRPDVGDGLPLAPKNLLRMVVRPERSADGGSRGTYSGEDLAKVLAALNPCQFDSNDKWLPVLMACHHATGGEGRQEFIDWSTSDPSYAGDGYDIGRRWDSLSNDKPDGYTARTLEHYLRKVGRHDLLKAGDAASDFADVADEENDVQDEPYAGEFEAEQDTKDMKDVLAPLRDLSRRFCTVIDGDFRIMYLDQNPDMPGRRYWKSINQNAFQAHFSNRRLERVAAEGDPPKTIPLGKAWIEWPHRPSAIGMTFDTTTSPGEDIDSRIVEGRLNLWTGFGCKPIFKKNGWKLFEGMIRDDLCNGNEEVSLYVLRWIAFKIQNPGLPCETSVVFKGAKGVGKTTLGEVLIDIFGSHGLVVSRRSQFAGQFSGHLATACFVFADEAVWGGNKEDEGTLKKLITDRHVLYRAMYKEETYGVNRVGLMMATNETWAVPATFEERRFVVSEVSDRHRIKGASDETNRAYWTAIRSELDGGGREAFMYDMQNLPLGDWSPRIAAPKTAALGSQIEEGLRGVQRWYYEALTESTLPSLSGEEIEWSEKPQEIEIAAMLREVRAWMRSNRQHATVTAHGLFKELKIFGWTRGKRTKAGRRWLAPGHMAAVAAMEKRLGREIMG